MGKLDTEQRADTPEQDTAEVLDTGRVDNSEDKQADRRHQLVALVDTDQPEDTPSPFLFSLTLHD